MEKDKSEKDRGNQENPGSHTGNEPAEPEQREIAPAQEIKPVPTFRMLSCSALGFLDAYVGMDRNRIE